MTNPTTPQNCITLTQEQYTEFQNGNGLFFKAPDGSLEFFASENEIGTIETASMPPEPYTPPQIPATAIDNNAEGLALLDLVNSLIINQDGYLELSATACQGLADVINLAKQKLSLQPE